MRNGELKIRNSRGMGPWTRMKRRRKWLVASLGLVALVSVGLYCSAPAGKEGSAKARGADAAPALAAKQRVPVTLTPIQRRNFETRLLIQGNFEAKNVASICPRIPGALEAIYVDEGDTVVAGETKLFQTDSVTLTKAVEVSRQDVAVAKCAQREAEAGLEQLQAQFEKADIDYQRFTRLFEQKAVTLDAFEQQKSRYKQTKAGLKHAETVVDLAAERARQAEAALAIAEKNLADSLVYAPISGVVSHRFKEPGEMGDSGAAVLRIADVSVVELSAFVAAQYYRQVQPGKTRVRLTVNGLTLDEQTVSYRSPTIEPTLRTFEVKCLITDPPGGVVPGAMASAEILLEQREALGIPTQGLQNRGGKTVVFTVAQDMAKMVEVETGLDSGGWTEIRSARLAEGVPVVTMGQSLIEEGTPVTVRREAG